MPRILSRNTAMYKRKGSLVLSRASSSSVTSSETSLPRTPVMPWYAAAGLEDTLAPSNSSTASSSPSVATRRSSIDSRRMMDRQLSSYGDFDPEDEIDGWGQFIDPAEAEEELIRSSKILSKRYLML